MILTCPECGTQYVVKDGAIPPQGRQVRCAACKHSWHQDPEPQAAEPQAAQPEMPQREEQAEDESFAEATLIEPRSGVEAEERAYEATVIQEEVPPEESATIEQPVEAMAPEPPAEPEYAHHEQPVASEAAPPSDWDAPPEPEAQRDDFSPFAEPDEVVPRRRGALLKILVLVLLIAAIAAAFWLFAPPQWKARLGLAGSGASPLALVTTHMDRQRLESGNELLTVTGRVVNPTGSDQSVPPLQAILKTKSGKLVYRWTIPPPARTLAPGASADFNSTEVDVPPGGDELTITLGSGQA